MTSKRSKSPNVLLILTDQQRVDTLGFVGQTPCRTPHIDRLAAEGISFDKAITASPLCTPARAAIYTGQYPHETNMMANWSTLEAPPTLTRQMRDHGYFTAHAGKWHLGDEVLPLWFDAFDGHDQTVYSAWCAENGLPDGWTFNDPAVRTHRTPSMSTPKTIVLDMEPEQTITAWITDHAIRLFDERPSDQPFFLVCSYHAPHPPLKIPEPYYSLYDADSIPEPPNFGPQPNKPQANTDSYYHQLWLDHGSDWAAWKKSVAVYWGFVTMVDAQIGRLLDHLENAGELDDTVIIFASDHGEFLGQHGLWHKMMPYEEALRVPFIVRYPQLATAGLRSEAMVSLIDISPTILSLIGESTPARMSGRDLSPGFATDIEFQEDPYRFSEHKPLGEWHHTVEWRLVTNGRYKYVWNWGDLDELYDLQADPHELRNEIANAGLTDTLQHLRRQLDGWMIATDDPLHAEFKKMDVTT